jgi:hypothetical protein
MIDYRAYLCKLVLIVFVTVTHFTWKSSWSIGYAITNLASSCVQLRVRWGFFVLQVLEPPQSLGWYMNRQISLTLIERK